MSNDEIIRLNSYFDKQSYKNPISVLDKKIFNLTLDFTLNDWKLVRKGKYWEKLDGMTNELERKKYTLNIITEYIEYDRNST